MFVENDPNYCVDITSTKDGKFITVNSNSRTSSEEGTYLLQFFFFFFYLFSLKKILFKPTLDFYSETLLVCLI